MNESKREGTLLLFRLLYDAAEFGNYEKPSKLSLSSRFYFSRRIVSYSGQLLLCFLFRIGKEWVLHVYRPRQYRTNQYGTTITLLYCKLYSISGLCRHWPRQRNDQLFPQDRRCTLLQIHSRQNRPREKFSLIFYQSHAKFNNEQRWNCICSIETNTGGTNPLTYDDHNIYKRNWVIDKISTKAGIFHRSYILSYSTSIF